VKWSRGFHLCLPPYNHTILPNLLTFLCGAMSRMYTGPKPISSLICSMLRNTWTQKEYQMDVCQAARKTYVRSNDVTKYLVRFYTFHLKQLARIFSGSEVIQFLHQLCSFWTLQCVHKVREHFKLFIAQELQIIHISHTCHFEEKL
jgi:hypothetical protein